MGQHVRVNPAEYERIDLRAHSLLATVPLHDVWAVDLPDDGSDRSIVDIRSHLSLENFAAANIAVRALFGLRAWLGRLFGWDRETPEISERSFVHKLSAADRELSLVAPGTRNGAFRTLFVTERESISEIENATVHAFSVFALVKRPTDRRLYLAIYVRPIGRITACYMRVIDPFRRLIIYPAILRAIREAWLRGAIR